MGNSHDDLIINDTQSLWSEVPELEPFAPEAPSRIYISCHSQMMDNVPQFLPADARGWGDGVSLSWLVRQLDAVRPRNARFYIIVNGCLTNAGRIDRWCRCCRRAQLQSEVPVSLQKSKASCVPELTRLLPQAEPEAEAALNAKSLNSQRTSLQCGPRPC